MTVEDLKSLTLEELLKIPRILSDIDHQILCIMSISNADLNSLKADIQKFEKLAELYITQDNEYEEISFSNAFYRIRNIVFFEVERRSHLSSHNLLSQISSAKTMLNELENLSLRIDLQTRQNNMHPDFDDGIPF